MKTEEAEQPKEQDKPTSRQMEYVKEVVKELALALESEDVSEGVKECLKTIICEAAIEADVQTSEIARDLPKIIENLEWNYGKGYLHSITAILRYDTKVEEVYQDSKKPLDLSEHPENLNIPAKQISDIMHNPDLPQKIYECLDENYQSFSQTPIHRRIFYQTFKG